MSTGAVHSAVIRCIPPAGILGSSLASLVSYSVHAAMLVAISSRLARKPASAFLIPGAEEWHRLVDGLRQFSIQARSSVGSR